MLKILHKKIDTTLVSAVDEYLFVPTEITEPKKMAIHITSIQSSNAPAWDAYVKVHPRAVLYHLFGWKAVIEKAYGHNTYYLMATKNRYQSQESADAGGGISRPPNVKEHERDLEQTHSNKPPSVGNTASGDVVGILPLVHMKHFIFGNSLISIPFFDHCGLLADDEETEKALLSKALKLGQYLGVSSIELRQNQPLSCLDAHDPMQSEKNWDIRTYSHKSRMLLKLPDSSEILMQSFKSKLRSQIKRPLKEAIYVKTGQVELLSDFYSVFLNNMRFLGSPVHSKKMMRAVVETFPASSRIIVVYKAQKPLAGSMVVGFKDILENPWASALRNYSAMAPNMLLYWNMLKYGCDNGYDYFDFGRSSPGGGTYRFKEQWEARPVPLHWHYISLTDRPLKDPSLEKGKFEMAIRYWRRLPIFVTRVIGPMVRKHIGL